MGQWVDWHWSLVIRLGVWVAILDILAKWDKSYLRVKFAKIKIISRLSGKTQIKKN